MWFEIGIVVGVLLLLYLIKSIYNDLTSPQASAVPTPDIKTRQQITLEELSKIWRLQCFDEEEAKKIKELESLKKKVEELKKQKQQMQQAIEQQSQKPSTDSKPQPPADNEKTKPESKDSTDKGDTIKDTSSLEMSNEKNESAEAESVEDNAGIDNTEDEDKLLEEALKESMPMPDTPPELFQNPVVQKFYAERIFPLKILKDNEKKVIMSLLSLLDKEGSVPSVVQTGGQNEYDNTRDRGEYDILKNVTLAEHSIHVAEIMIEKDSSLLTMPRRIISALAHDIGKIPKFYSNKKYVFGNHPQVSVMVLRSIEGFEDLEYAQEVEEAVLRHHLSPMEGLGMDLKQADKEARNKEVLEVSMKPLKEDVKESIEGENKENETETEAEKSDPQQPQPPETETKPLNIAKFLATPSSKENFSRVRENSKDINIEWLPLGELMATIRERINYETPNGGFDVFSDTRGYVFVQTGFVMDTFREIARKYKKYDEYDFSDGETRRKILLALADIFRANGYLVENFVKRGYFSNRFDLYSYDGEILMKGKTFIPFYASAFVSDLSELERRKVKGGFLSKIKEVKISGFGG